MYVLVFQCVAPFGNQSPSKWKLSPFSGRGNFVRFSFPSWVDWSIYQIWGGYRTFIKVSKIRLMLRYIVRFETTLRQSSTGVEERGQISHFLTPVKSKGGMGEMYESFFSCDTYDPTTDILLTGRRWTVSDVRVWTANKFSSKTYKAFRLSSEQP